MTSVAWIGLGAMGGPMAACVARAGHEVTGYDVDAGRVRALAGDGVAEGASAAEAASRAGVVVLMVATPEQGEAALFGPAGVAEGLQPGCVVLVMATVGPATVEGWARRLSGGGVDVVDAPVSGGVARAATGDLLVLLAGPTAAVDAVRPLVEVLARSAPLVGERPGDGQKFKLVNQLLCGVHIAVAAEALGFAESLGLDPRTCWDVLRDGAAASFMFADRGERMVTGASGEVRSALDIFVKDMGLVTDAARAHSYPAVLAAVAAQLYTAAHRAGLGRRDDSSIIEVFKGNASAAGG